MFGSLFGRKKRRPAAAAASDSIGDAAVGDVFTVTGHDVEYEDAYFIVEQVNRYRSAAGAWREALGVDGESRLWVSWAEDAGALYVTVSPDVRPVGLSAIGLTDQDMIRLDDEQSIDNYVTVDSTSYYYRFSAETTLFEGHDDRGEEFYMWDLVSEDDTRVLTIDKWEGPAVSGPFQRRGPAG